MDLLKEKYESLLTENKEDYPYVKNTYDYNLIRLVDIGIVKLPKFLKNLYLDELTLNNCSRLKTLEHCPRANVINIYDCLSLKTLEGMPDFELDILDIFGCSLLNSFKGIPRIIHTFQLHNINQVKMLRRDIESGDYKPRKIHHIGYVCDSDEYELIKDDIKYFKDTIGATFGDEIFQR